MTIRCKEPGPGSGGTGTQGHLSLHAHLDLRQRSRRQSRRGVPLGTELGPRLDRDGLRNEVHWNLDTLTQVYVNCGDPILHYYLRGALQRWHLLYKDIVADSLADYGSDALSEWLGLFDGTMAGRGGRASFGTGDILPLHYPVGASLLRVTCGPKAAFDCCKDGVHSHIDNYRYTPDANFAFTLRIPGRTPSTSRFPAPSGT